jgi:hypothetical protein
MGVGNMQKFYPTAFHMDIKGQLCHVFLSVYNPHVLATRSFATLAEFGFFVGRMVDADLNGFRCPRSGCEIYALWKLMQRGEQVMNSGQLIFVMDLLQEL